MLLINNNTKDKKNVTKIVFLSKIKYFIKLNKFFILTNI